MSEKKKTEELNDDMIRVALYQELESIEPPPDERIWRRIETELNFSLNPDKENSSKWTRYASVAAAALLIIVLSSIGIFQMTDLTLPAAEKDESIRAADEQEALQVEKIDEETEDIDLFTEEERFYDLLLLKMEPDPSPPDWQKSLPENLVFKEAFLLSAGERHAYHGAIYYREKDRFLWVKSKIDDEEQASFIDNLGAHIQAVPLQIEEINGYIHFELAGQPGLAWQKAERNQALLVVSGAISIKELQNITAEIY